MRVFLQEHSYRSGTENVAAIVEIGKVAELVKKELVTRRAHLNGLCQSLERQLDLMEGVVVFSQ